MTYTVFARTANGNGIPVAWDVTLEAAVAAIRNECRECWLMPYWSAPVSYN